MSESSGSFMGKPAPAYATPVMPFDLLPCCGAPPATVYYNPHNRVLQCHACGHVYEPKAMAIASLDDALDVWKKEQGASRAGMEIPLDDYVKDAFRGGAIWMRDVMRSRSPTGPDPEIVKRGELEKNLLDLSEVNHRLELLLERVGQTGLTPARIVEMVAEEVLHIVWPRLCPGYGATHVWAFTQPPDFTQFKFELRCSAHPERRTKERRR